MMLRSLLGASVMALALGATLPASGLEIGARAPEVEVSKWFNASGPMTWKELNGKVILLEKWATW